VIRDDDQMEAALQQLASLQQMLQAMRLHLEATEPSLLPLASESYERRIRSLQEEICEYLLWMRQRDSNAALDHNADEGSLLGSGSPAPSQREATRR
jgi:hypothetical protein